MAVVARNAKLRAEIDAARHDRNTLTTACGAVEREIKTLNADSAKMETLIQQRILAKDEVDHEIRCVAVCACAFA